MSFFRYVAFAMALILLGANASEASAQKPRKSKREAARRGPDGIRKGQVSSGNVDREMLLDRQKAVASAKTSGGMYSGPRYSMPDNKYDTGKGAFSIGSYKNKTAPKRATRTRKSKRLIDQDNPNGKMYQQSLNKRNRKFLIF
ncbi:hypothetical protein [Rufibacter latericius]|uniref:Secreted protein n=1 Tax=Rufibacter latericius TaxID=2487040 RepID=A0A3M9MV23_9BACT|nr:hypothetical protein [Rufibacter latericius]RNI28588.1 hypothetical protein EFB08_08080 [Rufibacter latericius]